MNLNTILWCYQAKYEHLQHLLCRRKIYTTTYWLVDGRTFLFWIVYVYNRRNRLLETFMFTEMWEMWTLRYKNEKLNEEKYFSKWNWYQSLTYPLNSKDLQKVTLQTLTKKYSSAFVFYISRAKAYSISNASDVRSTFRKG